MDGLLLTVSTSASGSRSASEQERLEEKMKMSGGASSDVTETQNLKTDEKISSSMPRRVERVEERILTTSGRPPSWDALIYPTVVQAEGETAIVACGGRGLMTEIRNYAARLSDERAVHKGTGAQGIYFFTATYGW